MAKDVSSSSHLFTGLVLSGGGARAAYQVGVLRGIADIMPEDVRNPFGIICGTSAGAINATALATHADDFRNAVYVIENVWKTFSPDRVYRTDLMGVLGCLMRLGLSFIMPNSKTSVSLLDNSPLAELLRQAIAFERIKDEINSGNLRAVSVTASGYGSGHSVAFFQGSGDISSWSRFQRMGLRAELTVEHLLASSSIPMVFPAIKLDREFFGDGAIRQFAPISPALHMGARKVLVVGVSGNRSAPQTRPPNEGYPSVARIGGHLLNSAFLDSLDYDIERLQRINKTLTSFSDSHREKAGLKLKPVECLVISPSQCLDQIAARYAYNLPATIRFFLRGIGATTPSGSSILSYLLFEKNFCNDLIQLGYNDALTRRSEIEAFMET